MADSVAAQDSSPGSDPRERLHRMPERGSSDRAKLDALLDSELTGVLATVVEGQPWAVPMLFARIDDEVVLHGSTGAGALRAVAAGAPAAFTVTAIDGLVLAPTTFDSSANYRSVVLRGRLSPVPKERLSDVLDAMVDAMVPGRSQEVRGHRSKELAATLAMTLPIARGSWIYKERTGGVGPAPDPAQEPTAESTWAGVIPITRGFGRPEPQEWTTAEVPESVRRLPEGSPTP